MKSVPAFELVLKGAMRDYRKDPTAPVQTFDVLPKSLAFVRFDGLDAKTNKREAEALADFAMKSWDKGLGANYKGSFTVSRGPSGGGRTLSVDVIPDYYQTATIQVDKIDARGNRIKVARYEWSRDTGKWSVA